MAAGAGGLAGVDGKFGGRQAEDQPAATCIHIGQIENITEERSSLLGILGEDDSVRSNDHARSSCPSAG